MAVDASVEYDRRPFLGNNMKMTFVYIALASIASTSLAGTALGADLIRHDGFETCWAQAQSKMQFLTAIRASIDGTQSCIPPQSGSVPPIVTYTICNTASGCGTGVAGCPVSLQAGAVTGDFVAGTFSAPGSVSNISVPVTTNIFGSCSVSLSGITLNYGLDYLMQTDGIDGVHSADMLPPVVDIVDYVSSNNCNATIASLINQYVAEAIVQAESNAALAIEPTLRAETLGVSICPLSAP